jgi:hypothetical protein
MITVGTDYLGGRVWLETELDDNEQVISFLLMSGNTMLLHLDAEGFLIFSNLMFHTSGERLRLTVNKTKKAKETKNDQQ